jgi:hypothetical protein
LVSPPVFDMVRVEYEISTAADDSGFYVCTTMFRDLLPILASTVERLEQNTKVFFSQTRFYNDELYESFCSDFDRPCRIDGDFVCAVTANQDMTLTL